VVRAANQGFFDVAVSFDDIFCAAKFDCENADHTPLELLFDAQATTPCTTSSR